MNDLDLISELVIKPSNASLNDDLKTVEIVKKYLKETKEKSKEKINFISNEIIKTIKEYCEDESLKFIRVKLILDLTEAEVNSILYKIEDYFKELSISIDIIINSPFNLLYNSLYNYTSHYKCSLNPLEIIKIPIKLNSQSRNSILEPILESIGTNSRLELPYNNVDDLLDYIQIIEKDIQTKSDGSIHLVMYPDSMYKEIEPKDIFKKLYKYSNIKEIYLT